MALANRGFGASIGIGVESTWGTAVARTNWLRTSNLAIKREITKERHPHLGTYGAAASNQRHHYIREDNVSGSFEHIFAYDDASILLLRAAMGANSTSGAGPYVHAMTLLSPLPALGWLTLETIRGTPSSTGGNMAEVFEGCMISRYGLSVENGGLMMASYDIIGETSAGLASAGTPTYSSNGNPVAFNHLTASTFNSSTRAIKSAKFSIDRNLERNQELGSLLTQQPVEGGISIDWELAMLWQSSDWRSEWLADTVSDLVLTFTNGARIMACTLHNCYVEDVSDPTSTAGGIMRTVRGKSEADATDQGLAISITNGNALVTAN